MEKILLCLSVSMFCVGAENCSFVNLDEEKNTGREQIFKIARASEMDFQNIRESIVNYTLSDYERFVDEIYSSEKVRAVTKKFLGDAIDKNKDISVVQCILDAEKKSDKKLETSYNLSRECFRGFWQNHTRIVENFEIHMDRINDTVTSFYEALWESIADCEEKECIVKLVTMAKTRANNLTKILRSYDNSSKVPFYQKMDECSYAVNISYLVALNLYEQEMEKC